MPILTNERRAAMKVKSNVKAGMNKTELVK